MQMSGNPVDAPTDNTRTLVTLGFGTILALMFALVFIAIEQMKALNHSISDLVEETNTKTEAAHTMRDAIRLRANSLKAMALSDDPFERDAEYLRYLAHAGPYRKARETLMAKAMDPREVDLHRRLTVATRAAQPVNEAAADLLLADAPAQQVAEAMAEAGARQAVLLDLLDELVALEQQNAAAALDRSDAHYRDTRRKIFLLALTAFVFASLIAWLMVRRISDKNLRISWQASHDELTGLINRREFERRLQEAIDSVAPGLHEHALLYMDLDRFKIINDSCGHLAGDEFLRQLAAVMKKQRRRTDVLARLGGDEFGLLLLDCPLDKATEIGEALRAAVERFHFYRDERTFTVGMSLGVVPIASSNIDRAVVLSTADTACYMAKEAGRNRVHVAAVDDRQIVRHRSEVRYVNRLRDALEEDRFSLWFQPLKPAGQPARAPTHVEILTRMIDHNGELVPPGIFIPVAERYNLMTAVDRRVIGGTLDWLEEQAADAALPTFMINLSGQSLGDTQLLDYIVERIAGSRLPATRLCFEITETAAVSNLETALEFIERLKREGCLFALDDFGSGLSSFAYLKNLEVDYLKIDGGFVRGMASDPVDYAMVEAINRVGQVMSLRTIAEFVEDRTIYQALREMGVNYAQGNGIAPAMPLDALVQESGTAPAQRMEAGA